MARPGRLGQRDGLVSRITDQSVAELHNLWIAAVTSVGVVVPQSPQVPPAGVVLVVGQVRVVGVCDVRDFRGSTNLCLVRVSGGLIQDIRSRSMT